MISPENSEENVMKYTQFWNQFMALADDLHLIKSGEDEAFQIIANEIVKVNPRLLFEIDKGLLHWNVQSIYDY
jgi:hypothetical protein